MNQPLVFPDIDALNKGLAKQLVNVLEKLQGKGQKDLLMAISGGNTPIGLFALLSQNYSQSMIWPDVHVYWVDERHVPFDHPESNYGNARPFLESLGIPVQQIYPMGGESDTESAAQKYNDLIESIAERRSEADPIFDVTLLGLGPDGHVASLFPGTDHSHDRVFCKAAVRPETNQPRISLTLPALNRSRHCFFMASGPSKADILAIIFRDGANPNYPASLVDPPDPPIWYLDKAAARLL